MGAIVGPCGSPAAPTAEALVAANLGDPAARHLLLLAEGSTDAALDLVRVEAQRLGRRFLLLVGSSHGGARGSPTVSGSPTVTLNKPKSTGQGSRSN